MSMSSLVILAASVFRNIVQINRQTDRRRCKPHPATSDGMGNKLGWMDGL